MAPPTPVPIVIKTISVGRRRNLTHQISENLQSIKLRTYFSASKEFHHYIYSWSSTWENSRMSYLCSLWPCASTLESLPRRSLVPNLSHKGSQHASYQQLLLSTPVIQRFMIDILWHIPVLELELQAFPNPSRHLLTSKCDESGDNATTVGQDLVNCIKLAITQSIDCPKTAHRCIGAWFCGPLQAKLRWCHSPKWPSRIPSPTPSQTHRIRKSWIWKLLDRPRRVCCNFRSSWKSPTGPSECMYP